MNKKGEFLTIAAISLIVAIIVGAIIQLITGKCYVPFLC